MSTHKITFGIPDLLKELRRMKHDLQASYREADDQIRPSGQRICAASVNFRSW